MKRPLNPSPRLRRHLVAAAGVAALMASGAAQAQLSPYFVRVSERISYDSNVFRVPATVGERDDWISLTSATFGINQPIGRQRLYASVTADYSKYKNNNQLDGPGYDLLAGLDWEAASKLSGTARMNFTQSQAPLADYGALQNFSDRNLERAAIIDLTGRYGGAALLAIEALANHTSITYSSDAFASRERRSDTIGGGLRYLPSPDLNVGFIIRGTRGKYPQGTQLPTGELVADDYHRTDFDVTTNYAASGITSFQGRVSYTRENHDQQSSRDFNGLTGELGMIYRPTGKLEFDVNVSRDTGSGATPGVSRTSFSTTSSTDPTTGAPVTNVNQTTSNGYLNDSRVSNRARIQAIWDATAKIRLIGSASYSRDRYDTLFVLNNLGTVSSENGNTRNVNLAARYAISRVWTIECGGGHEARNAGSGLSGVYDYKANTGYCSVALALD